MNNQELYEKLMELCNYSSSKAFYFTDCELQEVQYRIFLYRLAGYEDFVDPVAVESRGTMFKISDGIELVSRPMQKFFNYRENPFTTEFNNPKLSLENITEIYDKADGSLINTFQHKGTLKLKSKGSLTSDVAIASSKFLNSQPQLGLDLFKATSDGYTVNMEYCSTSNRIVLKYQQEQLRLLNVRHTKSGEYLSLEEIKTRYPELYKTRVESFDVQTFTKSFKSLYELTEYMRKETDKEGYVITFKDGTWMKVKTKWYCERHSSRDALLVPRVRYELVVNESADDVRAMHSEDQALLDLFSEMESFVLPIYNGIIERVEQFYQENQHLDQKEYAIKANSLDKSLGEFGIAMNLKLNRDAGYKQNMLKLWDRKFKFHFKETPGEEE